jgi:hypothetical protein
VGRWRYISGVAGEMFGKFIFEHSATCFGCGETVDPKFTRERMSQLASSIPLASRKAQVHANWQFYFLTWPSALSQN